MRLQCGIFASSAAPSSPSQLRWSDIARAAARSTGRAVTMVVPFAAGGPMDAVARIAQSGMNAPLGQQVVIEKSVGGGGLMPPARVAKPSARRATSSCSAIVGTHAVSQSLFKHPPYNRAARFRAGRACWPDLSLVLIAAHRTAREQLSLQSSSRPTQMSASACLRRAPARVLVERPTGINVTARSHRLSRRRPADAGPGRRPH